MHLRFEQWQRPRIAHVAPFSSDLPEHLFLEFDAWGRGGNGEGCSSDLPVCWLILSTLMLEKDTVVADSGGPEFNELLPGLGPLLLTSCLLLKRFGGSTGRYAEASGRNICSGRLCCIGPCWTLCRRW